MSPKLESLGVPHGFTTAIGGGDGRWSVKSADDLSPMLDEEGFGRRVVVMGRQVHGSEVSLPGVPSSRGCDGFDAHATNRPDEMVAVRTADCVPVLLSATDGGCVAAVHAGWRGLEAGVIAKACAAVRDLEPVAGLIAAIGPCVCVEHYEVGEEVAGRFEHGVVRNERWLKPHLDLRAVALRQLLASEVHPDQIDVATECTFSDAKRFGSYRRDGVGCGHQAAYIGVRGEPDGS